MTTKITVDAHAGWPVRVTRSYRSDKGYETRNDETPSIVAPGAVQDFSVWDGSTLTIEELNKDAQLEEKSE